MPGCRNDGIQYSNVPLVRFPGFDNGSDAIHFNSRTKFCVSLVIAKTPISIMSFDFDRLIEKSLFGMVLAVCLNVSLTEAGTVEGKGHWTQSSVLVSSVPCFARSLTL